MKLLLMALNSKYIHSNLAVHSILAYWRAHPIEGVEVTCREFTINHQMDRVLSDIYEEDYDAVFASAYIWNIESLTQLFTNFRKVNPEAKIFFGGPEVTEASLEQLPFLDGILLGEGEVLFTRIVEAVMSGTVRPKIPGWIYRADGETVNGGPAERIENLDVLPFPYEDFSAFENRILYYESTRGCPYRCSYCLSANTPGVRYRSVTVVLHDLEAFIKAQVPQVKFVDRTFNVKKTHAIPILEYLIEHDNGVTNFHFEMTAELLDEDYLSVIKRARPGLFQFEIGIQTTHDPTLHAIQRPMRAEKTEKNIRALLALKNSHVHVDLIAGLPYETFERFLQSFDEVYRLGAHQVQLGFLKILKGTPMDGQREMHGYQVRSETPYEILENRYISFASLSILKDIEVLVESYHNSGRFKWALMYAMRSLELSPSAFYLLLRDYFKDRALYGAPVSATRLYEIFNAFYFETIQEKESPDLVESTFALFNAFLKYDYHLSGFKTQQPFFDNPEWPTFNTLRLEWLKQSGFLESVNPIYRGQTAKQILKTVAFVPFKYDIITLIQRISSVSPQDAVPERTVVLFDYLAEPRGPEAVHAYVAKAFGLIAEKGETNE